MTIRLNFNRFSELIGSKFDNKEIANPIIKIFFITLKPVAMTLFNQYQVNMSKFKILLLVAVASTIALSSFIFNQDTKDIIAQSTEALQKGDADMLASKFYQTIEMELLGEENFYSKSQAALLIKNFFETNKPKSFAVAHDGFKDVTAFAIGTLKTNTGTFRVSIFIKTENNKSYIHQLRIEKSN